MKPIQAKVSSKSNFLKTKIISFSIKKQIKFDPKKKLSNNKTKINKNTTSKIVLKELINDKIKIKF